MVGRGSRNKKKLEKKKNKMERKTNLEMDRNSHQSKVELHLGSRDWKIFSALEKWGVLGVGQLNGLGLDGNETERVRFMFNDWLRTDSTTRISKRLRQLEEAAYIRGHFYLHHPKLHTLSEKGYRLLKTHGRSRMPGYRDSIEESLVPHELTVNAVGLVMSELLGLEVTTERERFVWSGRGGRSPAPHRAISDLWIVDEERPKAIEVEMTQKSQSRYAEIFEAYRRRLPRGGEVLYLTDWPSGVQCILEHARECRAPFIYACSIEEFRRTAGRAPFLGAVKGEIVLLGNSKPVEAAR